MENEIKRLKLIVLGIPITKSNAGKIGFIGRGKNRKTIFRYDTRFVDYEEMLRLATKHYLDSNDLVGFMKGPIECNLTYYMPTNKLKDLPNLPKTTCDALNKLLYADDSQIVSMKLFKYLDRGNPRVEIEVISLPDSPEYSIPDVHRVPKPKPVRVPKAPKPPRKVNTKLVSK
jgi:Holliday junction resolvase RusA-like endonuclease